MEAVAAALFAIVAVGGWIVAMTLLRGWVFSLLWQWFIVPIFHLPAIGVAQAIAISLVVSHLTYQHVPNKKSESVWQPMLTAFFIHILALAMGYMLKGFV